MTIDDALRGPATAEVCEVLRQFARDVDWGGHIEDVEYAADIALGDLDDDEHDDECLGILRAALEASAQRQSSEP